MADYDPDAPLVPAEVQHPDVNARAQTGGLADQWRGFIENPRNRAAMIQFGLALSQPISAGQNTLGHIGQAIGGGGEASDRVRAQQLQEEELGSKQELRTAQGEAATQRASAAETRANAATERSTYALERLQLAREIMELRRTQGDATAKIRAQEVYRKLATSANLAGDPPLPPFEEWYAGFIPGGSTAAPAPKAGRSPEDQRALDWATSNPNDPRAAAIKKRLGVQ